MTALSSIVLIGSAERLAALAERVAEPGADLITFTDSETLQALTAITKGHPSVVAVERAFAGTPRGKALINRINADASLSACRVRIVTANDEAIGDVLAASQESAAAAAAPAIDRRGTRRAPRFRIDGSGAVAVDGKSATLQDLSTFGAQIVLTNVLKPNQRVQMILSDDKGVVRFSAMIVWAAFEMPAKADPRYRVGLEFIDADTAAVDAFCTRHRATLTPEA